MTFPEIAIIFILSLLSSLVTSFVIQRRLKKKPVLVRANIGSASDAVRALQAFGQVAFSVEDFPDKDKDGVPDAFQNRKPLSEMLGFDKDTTEPGEITGPGKVDVNPNEFWIAIELPARCPRKFEYFILHGEICQATIDYSTAGGLFKAIIIKQTRGCRPEDLVELSK